MYCSASSKFWVEDAITLLLFIRDLCIQTIDESVSKLGRKMNLQHDIPFLSLWLCDKLCM